MTVGLCKKAYARHQNAFDLTLVDVVRSNRSLAGIFYQNPFTFRRLVFQRGSLFCSTGWRVVRVTQHIALISS